MVVKWIRQNIPCFAGAVPYEWSTAILREAHHWGIPQKTLSQALLLANKRGYGFGWAPSEARRESGPTMKPSSYSERTATATARWLESRYEIAHLANNDEEMERIAKEFADLVKNHDTELAARQERGDLRGRRFHPETGEELMHGAPLLRRAIVQPSGAGGGQNMGPYRTPPAMSRPPARGR
jgi:hypothetical protein